MRKSHTHLYTKIPEKKKEKKRKASQKGMQANTPMLEVQDADDVRGWVRCVLVIEMVEVTATLRYIPKGSVNELN